MPGTRPIRFAGTADEAIANRATHAFGGIDDRCYDCDAKPSHAAASYPCGVEPPREEF